MLCNSLSSSPLQGRGQPRAGTADYSAVCGHPPGNGAACRRRRGCRESDGVADIRSGSKCCELVITDDIRLRWSLPDALLHWICQHVVIFAYNSLREDGYWDTWAGFIYHYIFAGSVRHTQTPFILFIYSSFNRANTQKTKQQWRKVEVVIYSNFPSVNAPFVIIQDRVDTTWDVHCSAA